MKKYFMIFGLALVAGIGIFALTDSLAGTDLLTSIIPTETCDDGMCGNSDCDCPKKMDPSYAEGCPMKAAKTKTVGCGCAKNSRS